MAENLALLDGKPRTSMDFDGQKAEKEVYFSTLKKPLFKAKNADLATKRQAPKKLLGNSVTVARLTLDQLVQVRILVPQITAKAHPTPTPGAEIHPPITNHRERISIFACIYPNFLLKITGKAQIAVWPHCPMKRRGKNEEMSLIFSTAYCQLRTEVEMSI